MHRVPIIALLLIVEDCRAYDLTKDGECRYVESFELREIYRGTGIEAESRARDLIDDRSASVADEEPDRLRGVVAVAAAV